MSAGIEATLRERKKHETHLAIKQAALRLALKNGLEHLTIEEISAAADVSPRTFFNYFACKEDAIVNDSSLAAERLRTIIIDVPHEESTLRAVRKGLSEVCIGHMAKAERKDVLARQRIVRDNPALLPRQLAKFANFEHALTEAIAQRLGVNPKKDPYPALLATLAVAVLRLSFHTWALRGGSLEKIFDTNFDRMEAGL